MGILFLSVYLWCWLRTHCRESSLFPRSCIRNFATWFLLPKTKQELEFRGEIFAGWFIPASVALAITWVAWHVSPAGEASTCSYDAIYECFPPYLIRDMFIHGGIAAGVGGSIHLIMLREALDRARDAEARAAEERKRADEERAKLIDARAEVDRLREELRKKDEQYRDSRNR